MSFEVIPPPIPPARPPVVEPVAPVKRAPFESNTLWWLVFFDAAWAIPDLLALVAAPILSPLCFLGVAGPAFYIQRKAGDPVFIAVAKAFLVGVLAALPFPVAGTVFGATMLAWSKLNTGK